MSLRLILIGPPGVGKGTQAALLQERLGLLPISSGDIFRAEIREQTPLGVMAKSYIDQGLLVPDDVTIGMMQGRLSRNDVREKGFILDGFPRTVAQAEALDAVLAHLGLGLSGVVAIEVDDEIVVSRLGGRRICPNGGEIYHIVTNPPRVEGQCDVCGTPLMTRPDDNESTIRERLKVYHNSTRPVIDFYRAHGQLIRVDGSQEPEQVYEQIVAELPG